MSTVGYDVIHDNVWAIPSDAGVVLGYDTGTPDIRWTPEDWARFATKRKVHIDQGGPGSPVHEATVRDVERGAWTPQSAINGNMAWSPARPTIYCNQSTLPAVLEAGWKGDLWLAILSDAPPPAPPVVSGCTVVAVQYRFEGTRDVSVVFDPHWPERAPIMAGIQYPTPNGLVRAASVSLTWDAVAPVDGKVPSGYTVVFIGLDNHVYAEVTTDTTTVTVNDLTPGWTYNVHVWANGGDVAPPHASITVRT